jgi:hypothetical protein
LHHNCMMLIENCNMAVKSEDQQNARHVSGLGTSTNFHHVNHCNAMMGQQTSWYTRQFVMTD